MLDNLSNKPKQSNLVEEFMIDRSWDPKTKVVSKQSESSLKPCITLIFIELWQKIS